ncbi:MAG: DUF5696 domain-containing protein [Treponema sp.]|nr:DUF5696 domain-containing protein [Treponema sp.]
MKTNEPKTEKVKEIKEKKVKAPKEPKAPKAKKAKKEMPEGYIGRPKPMKVKKQIFHKPTAKNYVEMGIALAVIGFIVYLGIRLATVQSVNLTNVIRYDFVADKAPASYVLENQKLKFEMDPLTTTFTITQKDSGKVWYSNPVDAKNDRLALVKERQNMQSPFLLKYSTENGVDTLYDFYSASIEKKVYEIEKKGNEVSVNYSIGEIETVYIYPMAITEKDMDEWLEKMSKSEQRSIKSNYRRLEDGTFLPSDDVNQLMKDYPMLKNEAIYVIRDNVQIYLKEKAQSIFEKVGYTMEDFEKDLEMYAGAKAKNVPGFNITVTYKLDGDNLIVDVPFDKISYKKDFPIIRLSILPYFGAGGVNDEGFLLVPEGSGSIINFNNGKTKQNAYFADIYGWDYATDRKAVMTETRAAFPAFGISNGDSSFVSIIDKGAEYAGVNADIAGRMSSYNYVYAEYKMIHGEQYEASSRNINTQYAYERSLPEGESISQIYTFIDGNSYVDMAKAYRNYLFGNKPANKQKDVPVAVEVVGAVDTVQQVLGIPKTRPYKLTSYKEAADIITRVENLGVKNTTYKLSGFINGGVRQQLLKKIKFIKQLGGKSSFKKMVKAAESKDAKIYLDATVQFSNRTSFFGGFNRFKDPARFASSEVCEINQYSPVFYGKIDKRDRDTYYLLKPSNTKKIVENLGKEAAKIGVDGVSFRDNGYYLSSDYNVRKKVSRSQSKAMQVEEFDSIKGNNLGVMINGGNAYAATKADFITNLVMHGNDYAILDKSVPFYEIALHGNVNYSGVPINLSPEYKQAILEAAESGAGLSFTFMGAKEKALSETNYSEYFGANFENWEERFAEVYADYNSKLGKVVDSKIDDHKFLSDVVTVTSYENGYQVYVNFGYTDFTTTDGVVIPARDYKVEAK